MDFPVILTIELANQEECTKFNDLIEQLKSDTDMAKIASRFVIRPADEKKQARVMIATEVIFKGTRADCKKRYSQEIGMNPNARISLQEMMDGKWQTVKGTKRQKQQ